MQLRSDFITLCLLCSYVWERIRKSKCRGEKGGKEKENISSSNRLFCLINRVGTKKLLLKSLIREKKNPGGRGFFSREKTGFCHPAYKFLSKCIIYSTNLSNGIIQVKGLVDFYYILILIFTGQVYIVHKLISD